MTRIPAMLAIAAWLLACAGAPAERSHYLLRADGSGALGPPDPGALIGIGPVEVAPYLQRAGIVVALSPTEVREASFHLWAEPLSQAVRLYLRDRIATELGRELDAGPGTEGAWRYRIDVEIEQLHGSLGGEVTLVARWSLLDLAEGGIVASGRVAESEQQRGSGYSGLVGTETLLLDRLAAIIAGAAR